MTKTRTSLTGAFEMDYEICVITKVPDPETDDGNLATAFVFRLPPPMRMACILNGRTEVFALGEILILQDGREVGGAARKPSKWDVECEFFKDMHEAINRSKEVTQ